MPKNKLIYGIGVNDSDYPITQYAKVNGKQKFIWKCPFYTIWANMLKRCYLESYLTKYPTYRDCTVCDEWLVFSTFKDWMEKQSWQGRQLDKDLLSQGSKIYSPDTCVFVDVGINNFIVDNAKARGKYLLGVSWFKPRSKFKATCSNPFTGKNEHLGYFNNELDAHNAWRLRKHEHAYKLADLCDNPQLAEALRTRYR